MKHTIYSLVKAGAADRAGRWFVTRPSAQTAALWHGRRIMLLWRPEERVNQVVIWVREKHLRPWEVKGLSQALHALMAPMCFIHLGGRWRLCRGIVEWREVGRIG